MSEREARAIFKFKHFLLFLFSDDNIRGTVEGCANNSEKWKMDFGTLLADRQGVDAFRAYLEKNHESGSKLMTMWLIYEGT